MATLVDREVVGRRARGDGAHAPLWLPVGVAAGVGAGVVLRFVTSSDLWLDEALSVNIARLPLGRIPDALRHDGSPPLYYFLLHGWMALFGTGDVAVRALSGLASVATLPLLFLAGRRIAGARVGWAAVLLGASNPYAVRYATEARMYSVVALECVVGSLVLLRAVERPTGRRLAALAAVTAALVLTHYWALYLVTTVGVGLALRAARAGPEARSAACRVLAAVAVGALAFVPWLPSFLYQLAHTGAPWSRAPGPGDLVDVLAELSGGRGHLGRLLDLGLFALVCLALFARPVDEDRVELRMAPPADSAALAAVVLGTPLLAVAAGIVSGAPFVGRYLAVVLAPFLLLAARGTVAFRRPRAHATVLAALTVIGLGAGADLSGVQRTQAGEVARAISRGAKPGDVVAFCPDQLAPAVSRVLARTGPPGLTQLAYPRGPVTGRVDWADYARAIRASPTPAFARRLVDEAGASHDVWLYWGRGYRPYRRRCTALTKNLAALRPGEVVVRYPKVLTRFEHGTLSRYPPP